MAMSRYEIPNEPNWPQRSAKATPDNLLRSIVADNHRGNGFTLTDAQRTARQAEHEAQQRRAEANARSNEGKGWYTPQTLDDWAAAKYGSNWYAANGAEAAANARREEERQQQSERNMRRNRLPLNGGA
jgi:hypothetical protein